MTEIIMVIWDMTILIHHGKIEEEFHQDFVGEEATIMIQEKPKTLMDHEDWVMNKTKKPQRGKSNGLHVQLIFKYCRPKAINKHIMSILKLHILGNRSRCCKISTLETLLYLLEKNKAVAIQIHNHLRVSLDLYLALIGQKRLIHSQVHKGETTMIFSTVQLLIVQFSMKEQNEPMYFIHRLLIDYS